MEINTQILKHAELLFASIGVSMALFFGVFLLITHRKRPGANIFLAFFLIAFSLRIAKSLFFNYFPIHAALRNVFLGLLFVAGPSLWFYGYYSFRPRRLQRSVFLHFIPFVTMLLLSTVIPNDGSFISRVVYMILQVNILAYAFYTLFWLRKDSLTDKLSVLKNWLLFFNVVTIALALTHIGVFFGWIPYLSNAFLFSLAILFLAGKALKTPSIFSENRKKYANSSWSSEEIIASIERLETYMQTKKPYLDPELSLQSLSEQVAMSPKKLSQVINQVQNENYSQYIARYRVEEAKMLLASEKHRHYKIAAIAYESGFNSISSFNSIFRKLTHTTAAAYRQSCK
ncbi:helix-turn-helix transcriptional regulator [Ascidiimonas aurantiaca]|uniref:helix-turn-helix transcriptional regulator n=1 Tax=Ascidiimonas aurantiaca TaxID=1685432 RepID=UPI0030EEEBD2